jgi:acyl carrier protein
MLDQVSAIIADALYVDPKEVTPSTSLVKDLGAESIDFLDIVFRLEKHFSIKIPKGEIERRAQGTLSAEEFAVNGKITSAGLECLKAAMPEVDASEIKEGLYIRDLPSLFTVSTFALMVAEQVGAKLTLPKANPTAKSQANGTQS